MPYDTADEVAQCFNKNSQHANRELVVIGDSTARQVFWGMVRMVDGQNGQADYSEYLKKKHTDFKLEFSATGGGAQKLVLQFYWDPFFNGSGVDALANLKKKNAANSPVDLVYTSIGMWFARHFAGEELETQYKSALSRVSAGYNDIRLHLEANSLFIGPVLHPNDALLNEDRKQTILHEEVSAMNRHITQMFEKREMPRVFNIMSQLESQRAYDPAGIHFIQELCDMQARILLNLRCNGVTDTSGQAACAAQKPAYVTWVVAALLALGVCLTSLNTSSRAKTLTCLALCFAAAQGINVQREVGTAADGVGAVLGMVVLAAATANKPRADFWKDSFKGFLLLAYVVSEFVYRLPSDAVPFELANCIFALLILDITAQQVRAGLKRDDYTESLGRLNIILHEFWDLAKTTWEQNVLILVVSLVVPGSRDPGARFMRVYPSALHCGLHLTLFTVASWLAGRVLRRYRVSSSSSSTATSAAPTSAQDDETPVHSLSVRAFGWTVMLMKIFLAAVTVSVPLFTWAGLPFLDIVCLKFGVLGGVLTGGVNTSTFGRNKRKIKLLAQVAGGLLACIHVAQRVVPLARTAEVVESVKLVKNLLHVAFIVLNLAHTFILESPQLHISTAIPKWSKNPVVSIFEKLGTVQWELIVLIELVVFPQRSTGPVVTIPRLAGFNSPAWTTVESFIIGGGLALIAHELKNALFEEGIITAESAVRDSDGIALPKYRSK